MNQTNKRIYQSGFTLLELVVVLVILSVLLFILYPTMIQFVGLSKSKSAQAIAATIYTIADDLLYDDIFIRADNQYQCKDGCIIDSQQSSVKHALLIKHINEAYPDKKGSFIVFYDSSSTLQIEYYFPENISREQPDGIYPISVDTKSTTRSKTTTSKKYSSGNYPTIGTSH